MCEYNSVRPTPCPDLNVYRAAVHNHGLAWDEVANQLHAEAAAAEREAAADDDLIIYLDKLAAWEGGARRMANACRSAEIECPRCSDAEECEYVLNNACVFWQTVQKFELSLWLDVFWLFPTWFPWYENDKTPSFAANGDDATFVDLAEIESGLRSVCRPRSTGTTGSVADITGTYVCIDCPDSIPLGTSYRPADKVLFRGTNERWEYSGYVFVQHGEFVTVTKRLETIVEPTSELPDGYRHVDEWSFEGRMLNGQILLHCKTRSHCPAFRSNFGGVAYQNPGYDNVGTPYEVVCQVMANGDLELRRAEYRGTLRRVRQ